jgi:hypothetical protein
MRLVLVVAFPLVCLLLMASCSRGPSDYVVLSLAKKHFDDRIPSDWVPDADISWGFNAEFETVEIVQRGKYQKHPLAEGGGFWPIKIRAKGTCISNGLAAFHSYSIDDLSERRRAKKEAREKYGKGKEIEFEGEGEIQIVKDAYGKWWVI